MQASEIITQSSKVFYDSLQQDKNCRYRSWEHCYAIFINARNTPSVDIDYLSLHLAFYLASWGMYRGSSFLLQKDYKVHIPAVKELLDPKYNPLSNPLCSTLTNNLELLDGLNGKLRNYYDKIRIEVKGHKVNNSISDVLITKILMGTLGCVPAYDRYFIAGIKKYNIAYATYNSKSLVSLIDFYASNETEFEKIRSKMTVSGMPYPQMKFLDMGFWQMGYELDMSS